MSDLPAMFFAFGPFLLEVRLGIVSREGQPVALTPKEFDTLLVLVEARGNLVLKEDLLARVWQDSYVGDGSLARNISVLRKILGENLIETLPRRRYRLTLPVTVAESRNLRVAPVNGSGPPDEPSQLPQPVQPVLPEEPIRRNALDWSRGHVRWLLMAGVIFFGAVSSLLFRGRSTSSD